MQDAQDALRGDWYRRIGPLNRSVVPNGCVSKDRGWVPSGEEIHIHTAISRNQIGSSSRHRIVSMQGPLVRRGLFH